jgi:hypothetical protein
LAALFTGGVVIAGLTGFIDQVVKANKSLADMQTMAKQTGLTLADFQGLQFGGAIAGLTPDQLNEGLQKSAKLLNDASRNSNSLSKELAENGINIKNANGQLISQNQLLGIAADLIKRAKNPGDANAIAEMLGFTKEWIPLLEQGSAAMSGLTAEARSAGVVIDDEVVARAVEFDREWRKSSVTFEANLKAALLGLLPYVDDLIDGAAKFINSIDRAKIEKHANDTLAALGDQTGIPREGGVKILVAPETERALKDFNDESKTLWERIVAAAAVLSTTLTRTGVEVIPPKDIPYPASQDPLQSSGYPKSGVADFNALQKAIDAADDAAGDLADTFSKVAAKDVANDQYDRAVITVKRHTDQLYADADALGLGAGALAKFRTEAQLTSAAEAAGLPLTAARKAQIEELGNDALDAANDLAKLKVATQIDFSNKTKFLSADDVAIAKQLEGIYGNNVPAALASTEAAQLRVINLQKDMKDSFAEVGKAAFSAALQGKLGMDGLVTTLDNVAKKLSDKAFDNLLSLDPEKMVVGAVQAGASALISAFTGDQKAKAELAKAQQAWHDMAGQMSAFSLAAKGINLGPLTNELNSLFSTVGTLQKAAQAAKDNAGLAQVSAMFNSAVARIFNEFKDGTQVLTPLQQQMKSVNDEAEGLKSTLLQISPGFSGLANQIDGIKQQQINDVVAKFHDTFISGLTTRLNAAKGQTFLTDTANLLLLHAQDLANVKDLGNDPTLLSQVEETFRAELQKIVNDAQLTGEAFANLDSQFGLLQRGVHEFTQSAVDDSKALRDAQNSAAKNLTDYLSNLTAGPGSTQSPIATLASAQTLYQANLPLAQAGNVDAQNKFVSLADNLEKAARVVYASGQGYQDIRNDIINQGLNLPAVQATTDPVTQAVRDAITAIQIGNAALNIINATAGGTTGAVNAANSIGTLTGQILPAVNAGNAAAVANALQTYFNQIDPSGKLTSIITSTGTAAANSNSIAADTRTYQPLVYDSTFYTKTGVGTSNTTLEAIRALQSTATSQLVLLTAALSPAANAVNISVTTAGAGTSSPSVRNQTFTDQMLTALYKIVANTWAIAGNTRGLAGGAARDGGLAAGGWITGGIPGRDSVPLATPGRIGMPDEFVIRRDIAQMNKSWLPDFNETGRLPFNDNNFRPSVSAPNVVQFRGGGGNSNAELLAEVRALRKEVEQLRMENNSGNTAIANTTSHGLKEHAEKLGGKIEESGKRNAFAVTQAAQEKRVG